MFSKSIPKTLSFFHDKGKKKTPPAAQRENHEIEFGQKKRWRFFFLKTRPN